MRLAAAVLSALVLLGGCTVTVEPADPSDRGAARAEQWRSEQRVVLDLTTPLDRERAGFPDGEDTLPVERRPPRYLDVELELPGGAGRLEVPAVSLVIDGTLTAEPNYVSIARIEPWREGLQALAEEVQRFGFEQESLESFLRDAPAGSSDVNRSMGEIELDYLRFSLEARQLRDDDQLQLSYVFSWDVEPRPGGTAPDRSG